MKHGQTLKQVRDMRIHIIGIGGIGVSALARLLFSFGAKITGSDLSANPVTAEISNMGIRVFIGTHKASHLPKLVDLVIYSPAVLLQNPERVAANEQNVPQLSYPEAIAHFFSGHELICVAGTHGKSSTTALLGHVSVVAKQNPSIIVGTLMKNYKNSNTKKGTGKHVIIEADEYKESFLSYWPTGVVCTRIEADHLDYYKNLSHIKAAFKKLFSRVPRNGFAVINADDATSNSLKKNVKGRVYTYGISGGMFRAKQIHYRPSQTTFTILYKGTKHSVSVPLLGEHNVYNTLATWAAARAQHIPAKIIVRALRSFKGVWRRFDVVCNVCDTPIVDDYAHHPTEIRACISALQQAYPHKKLHLVYQPHQEDRLFKLFKDFPPAFDNVDCVYFLPVYQVAGRKTKARKTSKDLLRACIQRGIKASYVPNEQSCITMLNKRVAKGDLVAFVGAGDIIDIRQKFVTNFKKTHAKKS